MKTIALTDGSVALVDDEDFERVSALRWGRMGEYARSTTRPQELLHRFVMQTHLHVDHINGDGLDCRKTNLRAATRAQNLANRGAQANNTSGHKGVSWDSARGRWRASIKVQGRLMSARFSSYDEACEWYKTQARSLCGEFAKW